MSILFEINHPAHIHLFKHVIWELESRGTQVHLASRAKDCVLDLLDYYGFKHSCLSRQAHGLLGLGAEMLRRDWKLWSLSRRVRPKLFISVSSLSSAQVAWLMGVPSIILDDTEAAVLERRAWLPFATWVLTPQCYTIDLGPKQIRHPSYHELAYLHPRRFTPDSGVLEQVGLNPGEAFALVRFVSWIASHDINKRGFSREGKLQLVNRLAQLGRVLIVSEAPLPPDLEPYRLRGGPETAHHVLAFARLYVGEGATMASEAAMLGVPSMYVNSITAGTLDEQERRYGLIRRPGGEMEALELACATMSNPQACEEAQRRRQILLTERGDLSSWLLEFMEQRALL